MAELAAASKSQGHSSALSAFRYASFGNLEAPGSGEGLRPAYSLPFGGSWLALMRCPRINRQVLSWAHPQTRPGR